MVVRLADKGSPSLIRSVLSGEGWEPMNFVDRKSYRRDWSVLKHVLDNVDKVESTAIGFGIAPTGPCAPG
jgi:hypothetical protein